MVRKNILFSLCLMITALSSLVLQAQEKESAVPSLFKQMLEAKKQGKDVLVFSNNDGIFAYSSDLRPMGQITKTKGRYLWFDEKTKTLYFFTTNELRRVYLSTGEETTLAIIPKLKHRFFSIFGRNPVDFIQEEGDVGFDIDKGIVCFNIMDRNTNMASSTINYRIRLDSGKVKYRVVFEMPKAMKDEPIERDTLCDVNSGMRNNNGSFSPLGTWEKREEVVSEGDYIHLQLLLFEKKTKTLYAVLPDKLINARSVSKTLEDKVCSVVGESHIEWFRHEDILLVKSCGEEGFSGLTVLDLARKKVHHLNAQSFLVW